jgi:putative aminopeptidase FrvX
MSLPPIDTAYLLAFLSALLNTPSPTGFTDRAVALCQETFAAFPVSLSLTRAIGELAWSQRRRTPARSHRPRGYVGRDGERDQT